MQLGIACIHSADTAESKPVSDENLEEIILRIIGAYETDLPSGEVKYTYRMRTSESFGAYARAQELSGTMPPRYYDTNTCDADVKCRLLFFGQDFQLTRTTEFLRWGHFDSTGEFIADDSRKVPPHTSTFTKEGGSMIVQRDDSKIVSIINETNSIGAPLIHHLLRGIAPDYVPAQRIHQYDALGTRNLSEMVRLSRSNHGKFSFSRTDEGRIKLEMSYPDFPEDPESSVTMYVIAELDPEAAFMPRWVQSTRRDKIDSGIRYRVEYSDFLSTDAGRFVPRQIEASFDIVPKYYFPREIHSDKLLASVFDFGSEASVKIASHEFAIEKIDVPAKREIHVKLTPGTEIHNRILGKNFIYQGNLKALEKQISK